MSMLEQVAIVYLLAVAALMVVLGLGILIRPQIYNGLAIYFKKPRGIWVAAGIRFFVAIALWLAAPLSCCPQVLQVLAIVVLAAVFILLLLGQQRLNRLLDWAMRQSSSVLRIFGLLAIAAAVFILWALSCATTLW
ncbi:MAG: hypothetical protein HKM98_10490 [Gammaproteobacteria bacterium]|nr:hypothetical protein [Gammaproteobacteria bacterium]